MIGREAREQIVQTAGRRCGGLRWAAAQTQLAIFSAFVGDQCRPARRRGGRARHRPGRTRRALFLGGRLGVFQGTRSYVLQDEDGQISLTHSISAGLDYAAVGPEHAMLHDDERAFYTSASDKERSKRSGCARLEGIIPALESAHAIAEVIKRQLCGPTRSFWPTCQARRHRIFSRSRCVGRDDLIPAKR